MPESPQPPPRASFLERIGTAGSTIASLEPAHAGRRRLLWGALAALVVASIAVAVISQWSKLPQIEWRFEPGWLTLSVLALGAFHVANGELWRLVLSAVGPHVDPMRSRAIWSASLLARYVPTNALMVVTRVSMCGRVGVPHRVALAAIMYELALTLVAAVAVGAFFVTGLPLLEDSPLRYVVWAIPLVGLGILHPKVFHFVADFVFERLGREKLPLSMRFSRVLGLALLFTINFAVAGFGVYAFARAIFPVAVGDAPAILPSYAIGYVVSLVGFVLPAGLGAREAGLVAVLAPAMPAVVALAVTVAVRILQTGIELLYAAAAGGLARRERIRLAGTGDASELLSGRPRGSWPRGTEKALGVDADVGARAADGHGSDPGARAAEAAPAPPA